MDPNWTYPVILSPTLNVALNATLYQPPEEWYYTWLRNWSPIILGVFQLVFAAALAWLTKKLWDSTRAYSEQVRIQTEIMERKLKQDVNQSIHDRLTKEIDLLISPLKTICRDIYLTRGIEDNWWELYLRRDIYLPKLNPTDQMAMERFRNAVDAVDQYKYLAPQKLYLRIVEFIFWLKEMERCGNTNAQESLQKATRALFESEKRYKKFYSLQCGDIEERHQEITKIMQSLDEDLFREYRRSN